MGDARSLVKITLVEFRQICFKNCFLVFKPSCFNDGKASLSPSTLLSFLGASLNSTLGKSNNLMIARTHWLNLSRIFISCSEI